MLYSKVARIESELEVLKRMFDDMQGLFKKMQDELHADFVKLKAGLDNFLNLMVEQGFEEQPNTHGT